jgi:L-threonylcarbamoyladenylate synthase
MKLGVSNEAGPASSPGQQPVHYAPQSPAYRFKLPLKNPFPDAIVLNITPFFDIWPPLSHSSLALPSTPEECARQFYARLHEADARHPSAILIELPPDEPEWVAIRDRIFRATKPI